MFPPSSQKRKTGTPLKVACLSSLKCLQCVPLLVAGTVIIQRPETKFQKRLSTRLCELERALITTGLQKLMS